MSCNGLLEGFVCGEAAEVEGLAPAFFVEACGEVVIAVVVCWQLFLGNWKHAYLRVRLA